MGKRREIGTMGRILHIAICDDEENVAAHVKMQVEQNLKVIGILEYQITIYHNGIDLLNSEENYQLLFLDIEMSEIDGFTIANRMNQLISKPLIIFLTAHKRLMSKGYHVRAFRFLTKPLEEKELREAISSAVKEQRSYRDVIVRNRDKKRVLSLDQITHLKAFAGGCYFYTKESKFEEQSSLIYWKQSLPESIFIQSHKSYLLNLNYIQEIANEMIFLKTGKQIPLARRNRRKVKDALHEFIRVKERG